MTNAAVVLRNLQIFLIYFKSRWFFNRISNSVYLFISFPDVCIFCLYDAFFKRFIYHCFTRVFIAAHRRNRCVKSYRVEIFPRTRNEDFRGIPIMKTRYTANNENEKSYEVFISAFYYSRSCVRHKWQYFWRYISPVFIKIADGVLFVLRTYVTREK